MTHYFKEDVKFKQPKLSQKSIIFFKISSNILYIYSYLLTIITGITLQLLDNTCVGKLTYFNASYWAHEEILFDNDAGA